MAAKKQSRRTTTKAKAKVGTKKKTAPPKTGGFPERLFGIASPRSVGGVSMFDAGELIHSGTVANFVSDWEVIQRAVYRLQDAGFEILQVTSLMINIAGSRETYESAFNTRLVAEERETIKEEERDTATFFDSPDTRLSGLISTAGTRFEDVLEGVALEEPRYLMAALPHPPAVGYWHLDVPGDVSLACNADRAHRAGITGKSIRVAMVDSGWFRHPYFEGRGYRATNVTLGPGTSNPLADEVGHGTGESANLFAVAPDIELLPVKALLAGSLNTVLVNSTAAFNAAVGLNPHIITNSWGFSIPNGPLSAAQQALAAAVAAAVASGIVVVFSAGNGHFGFPGQHPDVISAGGVFMRPDGVLQASDYASGFMSNIYSNRRVPDLSGLVGMRPGAQYIMLPVEPGDQLDSSLAGGTHPNGDQTTANDGWAAFSGTSAAAPQIAGAAALVKQACPRLSPAEVKQVLMQTARDVTTGRNHPNFNLPATVGPDTATGNGLVDANKAVLVAKVRCLSRPILPLLPIQPLQPLIPLQPLQPLLPIQPIQPLLPIRPLLPLQPLQPLQPIQPLVPLQPIQPLLPIRPLVPLQPIQPLLPLQPLQPLIPIQPLIPLRPLAPFGPDPGGQGPSTMGTALTEEDLRQLEQMIIDSSDDDPSIV